MVKKKTVTNRNEIIRDDEKNVNHVLSLSLVFLFHTVTSFIIIRSFDFSSRFVLSKASAVPDIA